MFQVNFGQLHMNTLKRYRKHYDLEPQRNLGKQELVEVCCVACVFPESLWNSHFFLLMIRCAAVVSSAVVVDVNTWL